MLVLCCIHDTNITFLTNVYERRLHGSGPRYYDFMKESRFVGRGIRPTGSTGTEDV